MPQKSHDITESDLVWGAAAIGRVINRTAPQVRYLFAAGFFGDSVWKAGHRTLVGSQRQLKTGDGFKRLPPTQP